MTRWEQTLCLLAALLLIAPGPLPTAIGALFAVPVVLRHLVALRRISGSPGTA
jgi:UPF0716 family protein affecting phage T7 exclusion